MKYIVHKRFRNKAMCGYVNIPAMTVCEEKNGIISYNGNNLCYTTSENAHRYFARDDDGMGIIRGKLICAIQDTLSKRDHNYQIRWNKIWEDKTIRKFKRIDHEDFWLWNHDFYNADIDDLKYIAGLIGLKERNLYV